MNEKKNMAFVCHPYHRGGVTRWMADAAIAAATAGHSVYFVTVAPASPFFSSGGQETMMSLLLPYREQLTIVSRAVGFTFEFGTEAYRANIYRTLIASHVPPGTALILSDDIAVWSGACALAHKYAVTGVLHGDQDYYYDKAKTYHKQLSLCVCVSQRVQRHLIARCPGIDQNKIAVIPCGINMPAFTPSAPADGITSLAFIGRLTDYEKRAYDLVGICTELHSRGFRFQLHIAGNSTASAADFTHKFSEHDIAQYITFHGWQTGAQVQALLSSSDIALLTSNSEGMPLVMMEALAAGCGFTGTRVSGIEDYEHDPLAADCLAVYAVGDIADAATKITRLASIDKVQRQLSARRLAVSAFDMATCLGRYFAAIASSNTGTVAPASLSLSTGGKVYSIALAMARKLRISMARK